MADQAAGSAETRPATWRQPVDGDVNGRLALVARTRGQAGEKLGRPVRAACCFKAGCDGGRLYCGLCVRAVEDHVHDAACVLADRRARRAGNARLDAAGLLRMLMALDRCGRQVCRVVHVRRDTAPAPRDRTGPRHILRYIFQPYAPGALGSRRREPGAVESLMPGWKLEAADLSLLHLGHRHVPRHVQLFKDMAASMIPDLFPDLPC